MWRWTLGLTLLLAIFSHPGFAEDHVGPVEVKAAIERGKEALLRNLPRYRADPEFGFRILAVMALLNCGYPASDPAIVETVAEITRNAGFITNEQYGGTYRAGILLMLLSMLKEDKYRNVAADLARRLQRFQQSNGSWGDNSRTQFALLGLKAAEDLGLEVPDSIFQNAQRYMESGQRPDGGWGYHPSYPLSYGSMTVAGISSLYVCGARMYRGTKTCGEGQSDTRLTHGLEWLAKHFSVRTNPGGDSYLFYYLYGLERIGVLLAQRTIGGHDWYREGAEYLVRTQNPNGSWTGEPLATEFALLFLGKGSQPVAMQKLRYGADWNSDPYDVKELTEQASKDLSTPMTFQVTDTRAKVEDLSAAPILYLQGRKEFQFSPEFRKIIRAFVDQGGFIFASACCGGAEFDRSFRAEMKQIFPDEDFEPLPPDHGVYTVQHRITAPKAFSLEGLNTGCRTSVLYAPHDLCCGWGGCEGCQDKACVTAAEGRKLGVNMIAYALGFQRLRDKLEEVKVSAKPAEEKISRGALLVGQLFHSGEWDPDPASLPNLTLTLRKQTGMKGEVAKRRVNLGTDELGEFPLLYLTGHQAFEYNAAQIKLLREYLDKGGFLFSDACCGKPEFDAAFRRLAKQLYPEQSLEIIPPAHPILNAPYKIESVHYKPMVKKLFPDVNEQPHLEGLTVNGRLTVLYSRFNLGCELQGHSCAACLGLQGPDAYKVAVNVLLYAVSH